MSLMLASLTGPEEAEIAVRQGADIVDLKDVVAGFGTVTPEVVQATVAAVGGRRPVSAVVGEPAADVEGIAATASALAEAPSPASTLLAPCGSGQSPRALIQVLFVMAGAARPRSPTLTCFSDASSRTDFSAASSRSTSSARKVSSPTG